MEAIGGGRVYFYGRGKCDETVRVLTNEINKLMDMEECMWNQRSKTEWLQYGD